MKGGLFWGGSLVSILYFGVIGWMMKAQLVGLPDMPLNEVGDFFAGVFSPLAFLWLVLGFVQQGRELSASREALAMQAAELKNSVEQQKELVDINRRQHEADVATRMAEQRRLSIAAQPILSVNVYTVRVSNGSVRMKGELRNSGHKITKVCLQWDSPVDISLPECLAVFSSDGVHEFRIEAQPAQIQTFLLKVSYLDGLESEGGKNFLFSPDDGEMPGFKVTAVEGRVVEA